MFVIDCLFRRFDLDDNNEANKIFNGMLTMLEGEKWKAIRGVVSPVFTSGKLKQMTPIIYEVRDIHIFKLIKLYVN